VKKNNEFNIFGDFLKILLDNVSCYFFLFDSLRVNLLNKTLAFDLAQRITEKLSLSFKNCPGASTILLYIINLHLSCSADKVV
jgi:hypothetical protein